MLKFYPRFTRDRGALPTVDLPVIAKGEDHRVDFQVRGLDAGVGVSVFYCYGKLAADGSLTLDASAPLRRALSTTPATGGVITNNGATTGTATGYLLFPRTDTAAFPSTLYVDLWADLTDGKRVRLTPTTTLTTEQPVTTFGVGASGGGTLLPPVSTATCLCLRAADIGGVETGTLPSGHTFVLGSDASGIDTNNPYLDATATPPQFVFFSDDYVTASGGGSAGMAGTVNTILAAGALSGVWAGDVLAGDLSGNRLLFSGDRTDGPALWLALNGGQLEFKRFRKSGANTGADVVRANSPITAGHRKLAGVYIPGQVDANSSYRLYVDGVSASFGYSSEGTGTFADPTWTDTTSVFRMGWSPIVFSLTPVKRQVLSVLAPASWSVGEIASQGNWIADQGW